MWWQAAMRNALKFFIISSRPSSFLLVWPDCVHTDCELHYSPHEPQFQMNSRNSVQKRFSHFLLFYSKQKYFQSHLWPLWRHLWGFRSLSSVIKDILENISQFAVVSDESVFEQDAGAFSQVKVCFYNLSCSRISGSRIVIHKSEQKWPLQQDYLSTISETLWSAIPATAEDKPSYCFEH